MADQNTKQCLHQIEKENFHSYSRQVECCKCSFIFLQVAHVLLFLLSLAQLRCLYVSGVL